MDVQDELSSRDVIKSYDCY